AQGRPPPRGREDPAVLLLPPRVLPLAARVHRGRRAAHALAPRRGRRDVREHRAGLRHRLHARVPRGGLPHGAQAPPRPLPPDPARAPPPLLLALLGAFLPHSLRGTGRAHDGAPRPLPEAHRRASQPPTAHPPPALPAPR